MLDALREAGLELRALVPAHVLLDVVPGRLQELLRGEDVGPDLGGSSGARRRFQGF